MNEISNELSSINAEIVELERSRANINVEYIKKYSFENIENLSKFWFGPKLGPKAPFGTNK